MKAHGKPQNIEEFEVDRLVKAGRAVEQGGGFPLRHLLELGLPSTQNGNH